MATIEITATYHNERFRFANGSGDVIIGDVEHVDGQQPKPLKMFAVKGTDDESRPLAVHRTYRFYGRWSSYKNKRTGEPEQQFHFDTYVEAEPASRAGVIAYLKEAGKGNGLGPAMAKQIWERFGSDSVKLLREKPEVVAAAVPRLSIDSAKLVASVLAERAQIEHCSIELMGLLDRRGFPKQTARRAMAIWGNQAAEIIERNPYALMRFRGVGFKGTDKMYLELGHAPDKLKRQALCAWYSIASDTTGHTWYPRPVAYRGIEESMIGRSAVIRNEDAVRLAIRAGMLDQIAVDQAGRVTDNGDRVFLAEAKAARNERFISRQVVDAEEEPVAWPDVQLPVVGHDGYEVNTSGEILSCWSNSGVKRETWKVLKADEIKGGYLRVRLRNETGEYEAIQVSHVVLEAFVGQRPDGYVACHNDGNPKNNCIENLRWDTRENNEQDKRRHWTYQSGSKNPAAKLTRGQVDEIKGLYQTGDYSTYRLAELFSVSRRAISQVLNGETWGCEQCGR